MSLKTVTVTPVLFAKEWFRESLVTQSGPGDRKEILLSGFLGMIFLPDNMADKQGVCPLTRFLPLSWL